MKNLLRHKIIKRLDRYIIAKFLGTYVFAIALIISIAVVFDINEKMDKFMTNNAPLQDIVFDYYMNFIPYFAKGQAPLPDGRRNSCKHTGRHRTRCRHV